MGTYKRASIVIACALISTAYADDVRFSASVDQTEISLEDTVTLNFEVKSENSERISEPEFKISDFEVMNSYSSISMSTQYDSATNRYLTVNSQQISKVLRPTKAGALKISHISINVGGKTLNAPDIVVHVTSGSQKNKNQKQIPQPNAQQNPFSNYFQNVLPPGFANRMRPPSHIKPQKNHKIVGDLIKVTTELSKDQVFKGEQLIVSYYLYHQVKVFNVHATKYPVLSGFLREDMEIPVLTNQFVPEAVLINGVPYEKSLLARYAAYPLQEGKLNVDFISLQYNYYLNPSGNADDEDPLFGFFQQLAPRTGNAKSEIIPVQVLPLPKENRPENFSGGVGNFSVISAVDKYEIHANEAVTLTLKVEGKGNLSAIQAPKVQWPQGIELYDSKGKSNSTQTGTGVKTFEYLLIPRVPGKVDLPSIELSFFDPDTKQYISKKTEPIHINILDPAPGTQLINPEHLKNSGSSQTLENDQSNLLQKNNDLHFLKPFGESYSNREWTSIYKILNILAALGGLLGIGWILRDFILNRMKKSKSQNRLNSKELLDRLRKVTSFSQSLSSSMTWQDIIHAYETLEEVIFKWLEWRFQLNARSMSRDEVHDLLVREKNVNELQWQEVSKVLEFADLVRFAGVALEKNSEIVTRARSELGQWAQKIEKFISEN